MDTCSKCKVQHEHMLQYTEGGELYTFCKLCEAILDRGGMSFNIQYGFLTDNHADIVVTPVEQNMLDARKKRSEGKGPWKELVDTK